MRYIVLTAAFALIAGSALASSIEKIEAQPKADGGSIIAESCKNCPPLQEATVKKDYVVPVLKPGTQQTVEIRDINGEKKLVRTEAWMGGSPVTFVSKISPEAMTAEAPVENPPSDGIDLTSTTAAVISVSAKPVVASLTGTRANGTKQIIPLDISDFKLKLN
ncbi:MULTISPECIES: plant virulence effector HPE1-like domain-containing protein [unclassified Sinorhizobium]|uniref:plant virulence effector HPE1-like domain-containing protein n=1 Tax=unclassified Sinorhizobium TaxID=2613772 RepID=UPI003526230D